MAYKQGLFKDWVPRRLGLVGIFILIIPTLMINGIYINNMLDMIGSFGDLSEKIQFANYATTIGMIIVLPIIARIKGLMKSRNTLLIALFSQIITCIICAETSFFPLIVAGSVVIGATKILVMTECLLPLMFVITPNGDRARFYSFIYPLSIGFGQFGGWVSTLLAYHYQWQFMYYFMALLLAISFAITLLIFHNDRTVRRIPLYQVDWLSMLLLSIILIMLTYVCVYFKVNDGLSSVAIQINIVFIPLFSIWFIKRQYSKRRPFINLRTLKNRNVLLALLLMTLMQFLFSTGNIQSSFATTFLGLNSLDSATSINLWMIPGVIVGAVICFFWFKQNRGLKGIIFIGFSALVGYHILLYFLFYPGVNLEAFCLPVFIKGIGMMTLYAGIGLLAIDKMSITQLFPISTFLILIRSLIGPAFFSGVFSYNLYSIQLQNNGNMASTFDILNTSASNTFNTTLRGGTIQGRSFEEAQAIALQTVGGQLQLQSLLGTCKEIFGLVAISGLFILLFVMLVPMQKERRKRWDKLMATFSRQQTSKLVELIE